MDTFNAENYWEQRLSADYSLHSVGYLGMGNNYNEWLYRLRRWRFLQTVQELQLDLPNSKVLDIGSGTGFYIDRWQELGVHSVSASDITRTAVERLRNKYSNNPVYQLDVGSKDCALSERYDLISAMDVLFHIVDDSRFESALYNIHRLLKPGGYFIYSDNFLHRRFPQAARSSQLAQVNRTLSEIEQTLRKVGFLVISRKPMFYVMNSPIDTRHPWLFSFWRATLPRITRFEIIGQVVGGIMYGIDRVLVPLFKESPATELMICRKP